MSAGSSITLSKVLSDLAALHAADPMAAAALASSATPDAANAVQPEKADDSTCARVREYLALTQADVQRQRQVKLDEIVVKSNGLKEKSREALRSLGEI
ncbi:hypothetical protein YB2330_003287 [Saitoella coloradoensis]